MLQMPPFAQSPQVWSLSTHSYRIPFLPRFFSQIPLPSFQPHPTPTSLKKNGPKKGLRRKEVFTRLCYYSQKVFFFNLLAGDALEGLRKRREESCRRTMKCLTRRMESMAVKKQRLASRSAFTAGLSPPCARMLHRASKETFSLPVSKKHSRLVGSSVKPRHY